MVLLPRILRATVVNVQRYVLFNDKRAVELDNIFGFKQPLLLRAEHAFYHELVKRVPRLDRFPVQDRALEKAQPLIGRTVFFLKDLLPRVLRRDRADEQKFFKI